MAYSSFESIFQSVDFALPFSNLDDSKSAKFYYDKKVDEYFHHISNLPDSEFGYYDKNYFLEDLALIKDSVGKCLELYLNGYPSRAYSKFADILSDRDISAYLLGLRTLSINRNHKFFRTKRAHNAPSLIASGLSSGFINATPPVDLFHVPFEKKRAIGTNRFSIPGFPCLYLSDSLHTSWSEISVSSSDPFHAICFTNHRPLYFADLVPINFSAPSITVDAISKLYNHITDRKHLLVYALVYPIILTCHTKVNYIASYIGEVQFKSEYVIPQLLMQWYRERGYFVDGIRYLSCTAHSTFSAPSHNFFNYVLPVAQAHFESGLCHNLLINFSSSPVYTALLNTTNPCSPAFLDEVTNNLSSSAFSTLI